MIGLQAALDRSLRVKAALAELEAAAREPAEPPHDDPIFVCAIGWRCGSTLVQRILMTDPAILVWGETLDRLGVLSRLGDILEGVAPDWPPKNHWITHRPDLDLTGDWVANLSPDAGDLKMGLRNLLDGWWAASARRRGFARWGVKEVRWSGGDARVLRWLYPKSRFVIVVRHPVMAYSSMSHLGLSPDGPGFWVRWPDRHVRTLDDFALYWNELAVGWAQDAGDLDAFAIRYEDLVGGHVDLAHIGERLGLKLNPRAALDVAIGADPDRLGPSREAARRVNALTEQGRVVFKYGE